MGFNSKRLLTITCYLSLVNYAFTLAGWGPCISLMQKDLGIGDAQTGILRTMMFAGFTASVFLAGYVTHKLGLKNVSVVGPAGLGVSLILFSLSRNYAFALACMLAAGVAAGLLEVSVNTIVSEIGGERRAYSLNMMHVFFGVGAFFTPRIAGWLLGSGATWRSLFLAIGVIAIATGAMFIPQAFPGDSSGEQIKFRDIMRYAATPAILMLGLSVFFYAGFEIGGINDWIVPYFERFKSMDKQSASNLLGNFWLAMAAGRLICTAASRFIRSGTLLIIITTLTALCAITIFLPHNSAATAAMLLALTGFLSSGIFPTILAIAGDNLPGSISTATGIIMGFTGIGYFIFPSAVGTIAQIYDLKLAMTLVCGFLALMAIFAALAVRVGNRSAAAGL